MPELLSPEEFVLLKQCDAETELEENEVVGSLVTRGLIRKSDVGDKLSDWQKYRICDNPVFPYITLEITEKCNFNCLHCFAAADNNALNAEMSYENILLILDQAVECGIQAVKITGGEPMLHPDFIRIMDAIYARGMWVFQINTNGYFLRQKIIDHLKQYPVWPLIKISYDGIGCHDTMRVSSSAFPSHLGASMVRTIHTLLTPIFSSISSVGVTTSIFFLLTVIVTIVRNPESTDLFIASRVCCSMPFTPLIVS